jgi:2-hydroxy-3-keto-5-methylthiopentenyl-1-phosphate phosphatase
MNEYAIDWNNIDLTDNHKRNLKILEPYTFDTLLLEVNHNIRSEDLSRESVKAQAMEQIKAKYDEAVEILNSNLDNLTKQAIKERF